MRILVDECIDERFRNSLTDHDCQTARYAGLTGLKNGDLLQAAQAAKFDLFLTVDQGIEISAKPNRPQNCNYHFPYEVQPPAKPLATCACLARIESIQPGQVVTIEANEP